MVMHTVAAIVLYLPTVAGVANSKLAAKLDVIIKLKAPESL